MPTLTAPDLSKIERPSIDLSELEMPKFDLRKLDLPKVDVGDAVASAATAVGLMSKPRSRWPYVLGLGIAVAAAGWAWMNYEMLRERAQVLAGKVSDRVGMMRSDMDDESIAFPSADLAPSTTDYPDGFGSSDMASTTGDDYAISDLDKVTARS
jgi:hypothetical protein